MRKIFIWIILSVLIIIAIITSLMMLNGLVIGGLFNTPITKGDAESILNDDFEYIYVIADYLEKSEYTEIDIQSYDYVSNEGKYGTWYVYGENMERSNIGTQKITDEHIVDILDTLFKHKKYKNITKSGNTISFLLWSNLDAGRGVAYTLDGKEPILQFLTYFQELKKENWYYYEEDFNTWKVSQTGMSD